jgi:histidinol-phosphate aminotransferase
MKPSSDGAVVSPRDEVALMEGYHSPQVEAEVRLNTNESPYPPPEGWLSSLMDELADLQFNRYPDRGARELRRAIAEFHGVRADQVFCANGSNEVIQTLLLAYGGPGRKAVVFEPTYLLHAHISDTTATALVRGRRGGESFQVEIEEAARLAREEQPSVTFLCSPNNPTGQLEDEGVLASLLRSSSGLVVVDEAYAEFAGGSAFIGMAAEPSNHRILVVRTFSKTWSMAACRLGYLVGPPEVVEACEQVALPYHLDAVTQVAGRLALEHVGEMRRRTELVVSERERLERAMADLGIRFWSSRANFVLFRPQGPATEVWQGLLERSVLVRDCSSWPGVEGCLRVTVGRPDENDRFIRAISEVMRLGGGTRARDDAAGEAPSRASAAS